MSGTLGDQGIKINYSYLMNTLVELKIHRDTFIYRYRSSKIYFFQLKDDVQFLLAKNYTNFKTKMRLLARN